jgi:hypothetical protein
LDKLCTQNVTIMKTILVINDNSAGAASAVKMAVSIGKHLKANILMAYTVFRPQRVTVSDLQLAGNGTIYDANDAELGLFHAEMEDYTPVINSIDASGFCEEELARLIIKNDIWMMVKGIAADAPDAELESHLNAQAVLNRVRCPLLLVPENFKVRDFERITYVADLRYCRLHIVKYLAELAKPYDARLQIANLAAKGMPEMEQNYAVSFFNEVVNANVNCENMFLNNIRDRDLEKAVDVMVNVLHADLLTLVNHRFHFEEIFGRYLPDVLPKHITIPLLIFPC